MFSRDHVPSDLVQNPLGVDNI